MSWGSLQASEKKGGKRRTRRRRRQGKTAPAQTSLVTAETFQQMDEEATIEMEIHEDEQALAFVEKVLAAAREEKDLWGIVMSIERYLGRNLPWFLNLANGLDDLDPLPPELEVMPRLQDYEIGCYGHSSLFEHAARGRRVSMRKGKRGRDEVASL